MQKERSIAGIKKGNNRVFNDLSIVDGLVSYDGVTIGDNISLHSERIIKTHTRDRDDYTDLYSIYTLTDLPYIVELECENSSLIQGFSFDEHCYYQGKDMIGIPFFHFLSLFRYEIEAVERYYVPRYNEWQRCYDLVTHSTTCIQVWTRLKTIRTIVIFDWTIE